MEGRKLPRDRRIKRLLLLSWVPECENVGQVAGPPGNTFPDPITILLTSVYKYSAVNMIVRLYFSPVWQRETHAIIYWFAVSIRRLWTAPGDLHVLDFHAWGIWCSHCPAHSEIVFSTSHSPVRRCLRDIFRCFSPIPTVVQQFTIQRVHVITARRSIAKQCKRCFSYDTSVRLSVRLSVCLSVTCWYCTYMNQDMSMRSSLWHSPSTLDSASIKFFPMFARITPYEGIKRGWFPDASTNWPTIANNS